MEARHLRAAVIAACLLSLGASYRTENFLVTSRSEQMSRAVAEAAERYRRDLAREWLGEELAAWREPCPITVNAGRHLGAGGATSFMFEHGRPFGWTMTIQGSPERILDSVLPHEITHTVFATHFGRPLPRWADEGACTTVEHDVEKNKQKKLLIEFLTTGRGIAFNHMFAMKEYPPDVLPLYAQGYSLARFLIQHSGKREFVKYVGDGMQWSNWTRATREHYGFKNLSELQVSWLDWVRNGYPSVRPAETLVATANAAAGDQAIPVSLPSGGARPSRNIQTADLSSDRLASVEARPASRPGRSGWYARTRDKAYAIRKSANQAPGDSASQASIAAARAGQSVSRPQPIGRPRQRVIEWTSPPVSRRSVPGNAVMPAGAGGTVWR